MILTRFAAPRVFFRFLTPKWASLPLSGAGSAQNGGRFNRPGLDALYLALDVETALAEYGQGSSLPRPRTLAAYLIQAADIVDFSAGFDAAAWSAAWAAWDMDWKHVARIERKMPQTWIIADTLIRDGRCGLLYPSVRRAGGINLVVFPQNLKVGDLLTVHDPDGRLPVDQSSWPPRAP